MKTKSLMYALGLMAAVSAPLAAEAACPYTSIQVRVQPNTSTPWSQSATVANGTNIHVGVFYNGWGTPVASGTVDVYAVEGSLSIPLGSGWEYWWNPGRKSRWSFYAYCRGGVVSNDSSTVTWN
ncbi:hypothetical protein MFUL124B02_40800 [Myxococcus fulvus 124B02]|nr:hypothetical protein MFUL124B02_40800 [Myxococcus fulvus 124B02]